MKRLTYLMIDTVYHYAQFLGILNFCYCRRTGKAHVNTYITIYSAIVSVLMFIALIYFLWNMKIRTGPPGTAELHYKLNFFSTLLRIGGVTITVFHNWTKRKHIVDLINSYGKFCRNFLQKFQMEEKYVEFLECGIRKKFGRSVVANVVLYIITVKNINGIFEIKNPYMSYSLAIIPNALNIVMNLYYFSILNINSLMIIINAEVARILKATYTDYQPAIAIRLADELHLLNLAQLRTKEYLKRINKMYDIQGFCVILDFYVTNICGIYIFSMMYNHYDLWVSHGKWAIYFVFISFFIFYSDLKSFIFVMFNTVDFIAQTGKLLKEQKICMSKTNEKLEKSLDDFSLQLASVPLEFDLAGLVKINRSMAFASLGSTISNAIFLIQYDLKYTKKTIN